MSSPAEIVQACLVGLGRVIMPGVAGSLLPYAQVPRDGSTLCYANSAPDEPDQIVALYDMPGLIQGRILRTGNDLLHPGVKMLVRALDTPTGYDLINSLVQTLNGVGMNTVIKTGQIPNQVQHYVQSIYHVVPIVSLGEDTTKRRHLWSFTCRVAFQDKEPPVG